MQTGGVVIMVDLAIRYAEALLKAARYVDALPVVVDEIEYLAREFSQSAKEFYMPAFTVREQLSTVEYVLADKFHPLTKRFVCLLATMRRLGGIGKIADAFVRLANKDMGRIDLHITVYEEATPETRSELVRAACDIGLPGAFGLTERSNDMNAAPAHHREGINPIFSVDKSLLGGFIAECDGMSWDCSLRARLADVSKVIRRM